MRNHARVHTRYITQYRGGLMLYTCLCILAVDFRAFPRRLAKAETYGGGLMDVGVSGIVIASGVEVVLTTMFYPSMQAASWMRVPVTIP